MREHKYRAWNKENNEMHYFSSLSVMAHRIYDGDRSWDDYSNYQIGSDWIENPKGYFDSAVGIFNEKKDPFIIMQFTGLKDKNGKDIYEGDIVVAESNSNSGSIHPTKGTGIVKWRKNMASFMVEVINNEKFKLKLFDTCSYVDGFNIDIEVIGNVFENPELLN